LEICECQYYALRDLHTIRYIDKQVTSAEVLDANFERDLRETIDFCYAAVIDRR